MEVGSAEHKQLLLKSIIKSSLKIAYLGLFIGLLLMIPLLVRENAFSSGLFYAGTAIIIVSTLYSLVLAIGKYKRIMKSFTD